MESTQDTLPPAEPEQQSHVHPDVVVDVIEVDEFPHDTEPADLINPANPGAAKG